MIIFLLTCLFIKHFLLDFVYQPPFMWQNKGTYGHLGGIVHSGLHSVATGIILFCFGVPFWIIHGIVILEFAIHYHMDWFKMWYNAKKGWKCNAHDQFWVLTGFDQLVHSLTYLLIAFLVGV